MDKCNKPPFGPPFIGPDGPCQIPPDMPGFCPPPMPPTPPCMPPVPSVVQGDSLIEAMNNLTGHVNTCINVYNDVIAHSYQTLRNLELAAQENGSYYGPCEVWVEDGYYAATGSSYKLIHKAVTDRRGNPIRVQLHLAYGNTTNSRITQKAFSASKSMFADKLFTACPINQETGWTGNVMFMGAPLPHGDAPAGSYTLGFNRAGVMRVYLDTVTTDQMVRDEIVDAMGVLGVLIQNGQVVDQATLEKIPSYDVMTQRVIVGQNMTTREVIFLVCGNENNVDKNGLTSQAAAEILLGYGVDIAVEITNGAAAAALDKGGYLFEPANGKDVSSYAFWYISRACYYKGDYERELANLTQNYHEAVWQSHLNEQQLEGLQEQITTEVSRLDSKIDAETERAEAAEQQLDADIKAEVERAKAAEAELGSNNESLAAKIAAETERATKAEAELQQNINAEVTRAETAESLLQTNINTVSTGLATETSERKAADETLTNRIAAEELARQNADQTLHQEILTESNDRAEEDQRLENLISAETTRAQAEEAKLDTAIKAETARAEAAEQTLTTNLSDEITRAKAAEAKLTSDLSDETAARETVAANLATEIEDRKTAISNLQALINAANTTITAIQGDITQLNSLYSDLTHQVTTMDAAVVAMQTTINQVETTVNELKQAVADMQQLVDDAVKKLIADIEAGTVELPYVKKSGDTMTGALVLPGDPTSDLQAATKHYVDGHTPDLTGYATETYVNEQVQNAPYVKRAGDTMTGPLVLPGDPTSTLQAAPKQYVDEITNSIITKYKGTSNNSTSLPPLQLGKIGSYFVYSANIFYNFDTNINDFPTPFLYLILINRITYIDTGDSTRTQNVEIPFVKLITTNKGSGTEGKNIIFSVTREIKTIESVNYSICILPLV